MVIPSLDSVLDGNGRNPGPMDRRDVTFSFTVFTNGDNDAAEDLLRAQVAPGYPVRLVYTTDSGTAWYTVAYNAQIRQTSSAETNWGYLRGGACNFTVVFRIRPDWRPRNSEVAEVFHGATVFAAGTTFGSRGVTVIAANPQSFAVDARGTAGADLPTIPDTGATLTLTGPCGGSLGIQIVNGSVPVVDSTGATQVESFVLPFSLPTSADSCTLKFAAQTFTHNGVPFRPVKPLDANGLSYQREYYVVRNGVVNNCQVVALGSGVLLGGAVKVDFYRKRA